ncbi:MAG: hypothetical protein IT233_07470 [Bacteroidia bacterium]|nr:hypothetical protein [Bacteroidia bacterium]
MLFTMGGQIKQDGKVIGTFKENSSAGSGKMIYTISYFLPNGTKIAEATSEGMNAKEWKVVTMKDNKAHNVTTTLGRDDEDIAKYLIDLYYL